MNPHAARLLTRVLAGACAVLLLLALLQYAGLGGGHRWAAVEHAGEVTVAEVDRRPVELPPATAFGEIAAHPLFNADRQPTPLDLAEGSGEEEDMPPPSPLNVALTGIIVDADSGVQIAMLLDRASNAAMALRVGMPLAGEQAGWTLVEVRPRAVVFRSVADETAEIELETAVVQPTPQRPQRTARPTRGTSAPQPAARSATSEKGDPNADLARRVEERRRQMREEAERSRGGPVRPAPEDK